MRTLPPGLAALAIVGALLLPSACTILSPRADPSRFFVLTPIAGGDPGSGPRADSSLGVGPIQLPHYLDRPEIVTRVGANEVRPATFDYWAGSLANQFAATLAQDLQALRGGAPIRRYPWYAGVAPDLVVEVDVARFEPAADGEAHLSARWRIRKGSVGEVVHSGESELARSCAARDPVAVAAALSALLADFSREIVAALR